jgi:hypothetical protein
MLLKKDNKMKNPTTKQARGFGFMLFPPDT